MLKFIMSALDRISGNRVNVAIRIFMFCLSVIVLGAVIIDYGFILDELEMSVIEQIYKLSWWCYFFVFTSWIFSNGLSINVKRRYMNLILGTLLYLSLLPKIFEMPDNQHWLYHVWAILGSKYFNILLLMLFALLEISRGVVNFINKKTNPTLLLASGFLLIIFIGTLLLLLPRSTHEHIRLPVVDALFISTSAVCVTGLSPLDISQTFTMGGQVVIALLIQIGGLGVMTITSFFALFFMGSTGLYSQFALKDMVGSDTFASLLSTLLYILGFTFVIEAIGAVLIWLSIHSTMGMTISEEIFFSVFHSVSAFCNAGFSTLEGNLGNAGIMTGHNSFFMIISILVILGGIGYPILVNLKNLVVYYCLRIYDKMLKRNRKRARYIHLANINTRLVLVSTAVLLVSGAIIIAIAEWNGAFAGMPVLDKIVHSFFNSTVPRTAGFNSVSLTNFSTVTIIIYLILMWIGGASQSTAGGIKVNTIAVAVANFVSTIKGKEGTEAFNREISPYSVRRASATIFGSIVVILVSMILLVIMEPQIAPHRLLFEIVSALGTVGSSLDTTPLLSGISKIYISIVMFTGRVGLITLLMGFTQFKEQPKYRYPQDSVIIN